MTVLGETGAAVAWVGEHAVRYYASGRALTRSSAIMEAQAHQWANLRTRLAVARAMYRLRFPDEDPDGLTRRELLGREGKRVKDCYHAQAARTGIPWKGRRYTPGDYTSGDNVNQAITAAAQCMYGIAHAVVTSLGCSPALGFVHSGHELSRTRRALRDRINETSLLDRCVDDIKRLLMPDTEQPAVTTDERDVVALQSDGGHHLAFGINYDGPGHAHADGLW